MSSKLLFKYRRFKIRFITSILDYYVKKAIQRHTIKIVAVTGTIGKTSAKVAISQLLSAKHIVFVEDENHNSDRSIRLNFFGLEFPDHSRRLINWGGSLYKVSRLAKRFPFEVVILEMAESRHSSLKNFISEIKPDIGVITGVSPVHMRYFKNIDRVIKATWGLVSLTEFIAYNADFNELVRLAENNTKCIGYGLNNGQLRIEEITRNNKNKLDCVLVIDKEKRPIKTNFVADQSLYGLLAATTVTDKLGWSTDEIVKNLVKIVPVSGRMNPIAGIKNSLLIDDSFNASPISVLAALDTLSDIKGYKVAVLGSMNELGRHSIKEHIKVGKKAADVADILITVGSEAKQYLAPAAIKAGLDEKKVFSFEKSNQTKDCLHSVVKNNSIVLFKGSQGAIFIEEAIKFVMQSPSEANEVLVRQKHEWLRRKNGYFSSL